MLAALRGVPEMSTVPKLNLPAGDLAVINAAQVAIAGYAATL
jgi:hypothetical protein